LFGNRRKIAEIELEVLLHILRYVLYPKSQLRQFSNI